MTDSTRQRPQLAAYLAEFGERLVDAERRATTAEPVVAVPRSSRSRRRWRRLLAATVGVAVAGLTAAFVIAPALAPVDPVSEARAALGDAGDLVHFAVVTGSESERRDTPCTRRGVVEVWQATSGRPRWRVLQPAMPKRCGTMLDADGTRIVGPIETARDGDTQTTWVPRIGRLLILTDTGYPVGGDLPSLLFSSPAPRGAAASSGDPIGWLRALLDEGTLREGHRSEIDGRDVVHLVGATRHKSELGDGMESESRFDLAVDARTFAPVRFVTRSISDFTRLNPSVTSGGDGWETWTATFLTYEQQPLTARAARELTIRPATTPTTAIRLTRAEFERRAKARGKRESELGRRNAQRAQARLARERAAAAADRK